MRIVLSSLQIVTEQKAFFCAVVWRCYFVLKILVSLLTENHLEGKHEIYVIGLHYTGCVETHITNPEVQINPTLAGLQCIAVVAGPTHNLV